LFLIISYIILSISLYFLFPKANVAGWKGLVPVLNFLEWAKIIGRKKWYILWLFFPIVNLFIFVTMAIDLVRSFGKYGFKDAVITFIYAPVSFFRIAFDKSSKYIGQTVILEKEYNAKLKEAKANQNVHQFNKLMARNPYKKSMAREWTESLVFAIFAAAFIRMFLIEAYVIPTPSMEGSLNVGDFLFVSKAHYGIRTPMTVAMVTKIKRFTIGKNNHRIYHFFLPMIFAHSKKFNTGTSPFHPATFAFGNRKYRLILKMMYEMIRNNKTVKTQ